ncbi:MAG: hypothetical protein P8126_11015 [Gammaproteobacteria bacterium]|jgi:hypothetical protein
MRILIFLILAGVSFLSHAVDKKGNYAVWGVGQKSCFSFTRARASGKYDEYKYFTMGYLTAYNALIPDTYRISGVKSFPDVMTWLDKYCQKKPVHSYNRAIGDYIVAHHDSRLAKQPDRTGW